jgi:hypothetical protein
MAHALDDNAASRFVLKYLAIRYLRIHGRLIPIALVFE